MRFLRLHQHLSSYLMDSVAKSIKTEHLSDSLNSLLSELTDRKIIRWYLSNHLVLLQFADHILGNLPRCNLLPLSFQLLK